MLQLAFRGKVIADDDKNALKINQTLEYGASFAILSLIKQLGLDKIIAGNVLASKEQWVQDILAMIAGRIIYQGSKLSLCNQYDNTTLWQQCGINDRPNVDKLSSDNYNVRSASIIMTDF